MRFLGPVFPANAFALKGTLSKKDWMLAPLALAMPAAITCFVLYQFGVRPFSILFLVLCAGSVLMVMRVVSRRKTASAARASGSANGAG
ncbi:hypothetical protein [Streptomyces bohaiensis]|uniref:hypothetical protein n=1 Tax=Streptomyces bohaiensis TaxID=1431344 RepID=UPI003B7BACA2